MSRPKDRLQYVQFRGNENVTNAIPRQTRNRWRKRKHDEQEVGMNNQDACSSKNNYQEFISDSQGPVASSSSLGNVSFSINEEQLINHVDNVPDYEVAAVEHEIPQEGIDYFNDGTGNESAQSLDNGEPWEETPPNEDSTCFSSENRQTNVEYIFMLLGLQVKHKLTKVAVADICKFVNLIKGENVLPPSYYLFESAIKSYKSEVEFHNLCPQCNCYIGKTTDSNVECSCGNTVVIKENISKGNFFVYLPIESQLRNMMENSYLQSKMKYMNTREKNVSSNIEDIFDGKLFKSQMNQFLETVPDDTFVISLNINTDGVPVFTSSKCSIWPIICAVNNLPPALRKKHILLASLWFGEKKPDMNEFFKPFISELNNLAEKGFQYSTTSGCISKCHVLAMVAICDSVARPILQNMMQFNGEFGCSFCLHPGETVVRGKGTARVYPLDNFEKRNHEQWIEMSTKASEDHSVVNGIKGESIFFSLMLFNMVSSFLPDYMHSVLLGVVRQFFRLWFDSRNHSMPWYIGNQTNEVDAKLLSIQPPYVLSRTPRSVDNSKYWKAHEWYNWLFYYSFVVLKGILPSKYLFHWVFLVKSVHTLLQESMSKADISMAHSSLEAFVKMTQDLYGKEHVTFNVHQCIHLADSALDWGPLWAHSGFIFENFNGILLEMVKSSKGVPQQIASSYQHLQIVNAHNYITTDISKNFMFLPTLLPKNSVLQSSEKIVILQGITLLGITSKTVIKDTHRLAITSCSNHQMDNKAIVQYSQRIIVNNVVFHSSSYKKVKKRNSYTALLKSGTYFEIETFIVVEGVCFAVGYYLKTLKTRCVVSNLPPNVMLKHIKPVKRESSKVSAIMAVNLKSLVLFIDERELFDNSYLSLPPNSYEMSM